MNKSYRISFGKWGEKIATSYLIEKGYEILCLNYRSPYGEIDIIAKDHDTLVFCEVKTRRSLQFGYPEEAVSSKKMEHIHNSAQIYIQQLSTSEINWRIDILAITHQPKKAIEIYHIENAIKE